MSDLITRASDLVEDLKFEGYHKAAQLVDELVDTLKITQRELNEIESVLAFCIDQHITLNFFRNSIDMWALNKRGRIDNFQHIVIPSEDEVAIKTFLALINKSREALKEKESEPGN